MRHKSGSGEIVRADRKMADMGEVGQKVAALPRVAPVGILYVMISAQNNE
jgi:hypothetical protein